MNNHRATFPKKERLSKQRHLDTLFQDGMSFVAYPLRVIYLPVEDTLKVTSTEAPVSMMVSVPKKKIRHAVDRNFIKSRIRESYRLRKHDLIRLYAENDQKLWFALIYLNNEKSPFENIDRAMAKVIFTLKGKLKIE